MFLGDVNGGYKLTKSQEKINHLLNKDDIKELEKKMKKNWRHWYKI